MAIGFTTTGRNNEHRAQGFQVRVGVTEWADERTRGGDMEGDFLRWFASAKNTWLVTGYRSWEQTNERQR